MNYIKKYNKHVKKNGLVGLLPQNIPNEILERMLAEISSYKNENNHANPILITMATLSIQNKTIIHEVSEYLNNINDKLISDIEIYLYLICIEDMRRSGVLYIPNHKLPTLSNIFNKNTTFEIII